MEDAGFGGIGVAKRRRDESEEAPEAKRIRAADLILLDILDDADPSDGDLASVMRSFEEEIASFSPPPADQQRPEGAATETPPSTEGRRGSDLGYLLEASDDELGLPPTVPSSSDEGEGAEGDLVEGGSQGTAVGFGQIWGLDDEIPNCYDALEFGVFGQDGRVAGGDDGVVFDGGLFDYADFVSMAEFAEFSWQPESLPAV